MFSLLTLVAFGIIGTLLVGIQYYALHTQSWALSKLWTKSWMLFFLLMTVRMSNVCMNISIAFIACWILVMYKFVITLLVSPFVYMFLCNLVSF